MDKLPVEFQEKRISDKQSSRSAFNQEKAEIDLVSSHARTSQCDNMVDDMDFENLLESRQEKNTLERGQLAISKVSGHSG